MIKVKICGIRDLAGALAAVDAGADFLGFNFVPESRRYIRPEDALTIIKRVGGRVNIVGVFRDAPLEVVNRCVKQLGLGYVQLHGNESAEYVRQVNAAVIKAIPVGDVQSEALITRMCEYPTSTLFLLDRPVQGRGEPVDLDVAAVLCKHFTCFLAGGLTFQTVASAIVATRPYGVDVAGGIEMGSQIDPTLVQSFISQSRVAVERLSS